MCSPGSMRASRGQTMHYGGMTRRTGSGLIVLAAAAALLLSACSPSTTVVSPDTTQPRTVSVSSTGIAQAKPDAAKASLTIETQDPTSAKAAQATAAIAATKVLDAIKAAGIADDDIATQGINVGPVYNYTSDGGQTLIGYRAAQTLTVTLRDLATAGATLDAIVAAGGNAARIDSLAPFVTDPTVAASKARAQAVEIARAQAEQYAKLLGFTLGPVASVSESSSNAQPQPIAYADSAGASAERAPTPIEPGTQDVSVTLNVAWSIAD